MEERIPGTDPPAIENQDVMNLLSSAAEMRAFERFHSSMTAASEKNIDYHAALQIWLSDHADRWRRQRQITAAQLQAEEIRKHRWIESEKKHADVGKVAHLEWVTTHASDWRHWYENHYDGPLADND